MVTINVSTGYINSTQNNNRIIPNEACAPTSGAMFLNYSKVDYFSPKGVQPEDYIMATLNGKFGYDKLLEIAPQLYPDYAPNEVHGCLEWCLSEIVGRKISHFSTSWTTAELLFSLVKGKPVIISGKLAGLNHVVILVGFKTTQENIKEIQSPNDINLGLVESVSFDDPYGDPRSGKYDRTVSGNDLKIELNYFYNNFKPLKSDLKWGHMHIDVAQKLRGNLV